MSFTAMLARSAIRYWTSAIRSSMRAVLFAIATETTRAGFRSDRFSLADARGLIRGLILGRRVPPRVVVKGHFARPALWRLCVSAARRVRRARPHGVGAV